MEWFKPEALEKSQREYLEWLLDKILQNGMKGFHLPRGSCDDPLT